MQYETPCIEFEVLEEVCTGGLVNTSTPDPDDTGTWTSLDYE